MSSGVIGWDSSLLYESELLWSCCSPQCSEMAAEVLSASLELSPEWTPNPSVLSALEESGLSGGGEFVGESGSRESCAVACALRC